MANGELILEIAAEGAGATFARTRRDTGEWAYFATGTTIDLDSDDIDYWRSWESCFFPSLEESLSSFSKDGDWILLTPLAVHPEFRQFIWELAQRIAMSLPEHKARHWRNSSAQRWRRLCNPAS